MIHINNIYRYQLLLTHKTDPPPVYKIARTPLRNVCESLLFDGCITEQGQLRKTIVWHSSQGRLHECVWCTWELEWTGGPRAGRRVGIGTAAGWRRRIRRIGRNGERASSASVAVAAAAVWLRKRVWKGGVQGHVWLVMGEVAELYEQAVLWVVFAVPRYQDGWEYWMVENKTGEGAERRKHTSVKYHLPMSLIVIHLARKHVYTELGCT